MYLLYCELEEVVSNYAVSLKNYNANWNAFIHSSSAPTFSYTRGCVGYAGTYRVHVFEMWEEANFFHHMWLKWAMWKERIVSATVMPFKGNGREHSTAYLMLLLSG